jgi:hypothetical protein
MKHIFFALLLMAVSMALAQAPKPSTAEYTVAVHVLSSRLTDDCSSTCVWAQHLSVTIDKKKYELEDASPRTDLLRAGDYKAKIVQDDTTRPYAYLRTYEFLFADGQTRRYIVVGEGE